MISHLVLGVIAASRAAGLILKPLSRLNLAQMAAFSSGMPSGSVYLVLPALMASMAAFLMLPGVSKSGSPAERAITSRPAAFSARALALMAMVADGAMRRRAADSSDILQDSPVLAWSDW